MLLRARYKLLSYAQSLWQAAIYSFTDGGFVCDRGLMLDVQLTKETPKITNEIPLSEVVGWSLLKGIKGGF